MNDQACMCEAHRLEHLLKQVYPLRDVEPVLIGIARDGDAVDPLDRQIGPLIGADVGVIQPRNVRVFQAGKQIAFMDEARGDGGRLLQQRVWDLQCHTAQHIHGLLGEPD